MHGICYIVMKYYFKIASSMWQTLSQNSVYKDGKTGSWPWENYSHVEDMETFKKFSLVKRQREALVM